MMPSETSCMPLLEIIDMMYGESNGTPLCQKFHYKLIFTNPKKTKSTFLMWWLLT
jgi:hypothetical protein